MTQKARRQTQASKELLITGISLLWQYARACIRARARARVRSHRELMCLIGRSERTEKKKRGGGSGSISFLQPRSGQQGNNECNLK